MTSYPTAREDFAGGFFVSGQLSKRERSALLALAAAAWWLSLQGAFVLGWVALVPLFIAVHGLPARSRFLCGWRCGWLAYATINWWIIPTVAKGSPMIGAPPVAGFLLGILAVALIGAIHGVLVGLVCLLWEPRAALYRRAPWLLPLVVATAWALLDAARLETPLAHGWGALAYSQARDAALLPHARWLGQHGLSALCVWCAACLALWMHRSRSGFCRLWLTPLVVLAALHLSSPLLVLRPAREMRVLLVQTNVSSLGKNFALDGESGLQQALRLTREAGGTHDLIVWPETTFDAGWLTKQQVQLVSGGRLPDGSVNGGPAGISSASSSGGPSLDAVLAARMARETGSYLLCGATARDPQGRMLNAALLFAPDGSVTWTAKSRLVPFGERAPWSEALPLLSRLAPNPQMSPPDEVRPLEMKLRGETVRLGAIVCFESCFRFPARALLQQGGALLFVLTNDEWFAGTTAPGEHAAMLAIRAAENGTATAQSANGGKSAVVDPSGRFVLNGFTNTAQADSVLLPY